MSELMVIFLEYFSAHFSLILSEYFYFNDVHAQCSYQTTALQHYRTFSGNAAL